MHPAVPDDPHDQRRGGRRGDEIAELLPHPTVFGPQDRHLRAVRFPLDTIHHAGVEPFPVPGSRIGDAGRLIDPRQVGQQRAAFPAAAQMFFHPGAVGGGQFPVVEGGQPRLRFPAIHHEPPPSAASSRVRARERRDITVPAGIPAARAISP